MKQLINQQALEALAVRDFRLYWFGNTLSRLGNEMQTVALAWQIYLLTHEPLSLGLIGLVRAGPAILFSILGGALADTISRRQLLLITQTILLILAGLMALFTATGLATVWVLYLLTFLAATASSADGPAQAAVIPSLVPRAMMVNAITLNNLSSSVAGILGPALGGIIIGWLGASVAFAIDALSFLAVVWALLLVKTPLLPPDLTPQERSVKGSLIRIREGISFLIHQPIMLSLMLLDFFAVLFGASLTLLPVFASDILKAGPEGLGVLAAAPAVGSVLGAVGLTVLRRPQWPGRVVITAIGLYGICVVGFGLSTIFWVSWLFLAGTGATDTVSMTMRQSIRQLLAPENMRGRVAGISFLFAVSGTQLGEFEAGVAAQLLSSPVAVALGGTACMVLVGLVVWRVPVIRNFTEQTENGEVVTPSVG